jgi:single-strand DNA-binding protein
METGASLAGALAAQGRRQSVAAVTEPTVAAPMSRRPGMANEAAFSVTGYVATQPKSGYTKNGTRTLYMRVGWTPRRIDKRTGDWADQPTSFVSVTCYRKVAENAAACLRRGDPVVVKGTLQVREYGDDKRVTVDVFAESIGHDLSRGVTIFKKNTEQLEQTALEHERAMAAEGRQPLPNDRSARERAGQPYPEAPYPEGPDPDGPYPEGPDPEGDESAELEPEGGARYPAERESASNTVQDPDDDDGVFDDEARQMMAQADESAQPVPAAA